MISGSRRLPEFVPGGRGASGALVRPVEWHAARAARGVACVGTTTEAARSPGALIAILDWLRTPAEATAIESLRALGRSNWILDYQASNRS